MKDIYLEGKYQEFRKQVVATKFTQVYGDISGVVLGITSSLTLRLLFWIIVKMDDDNLVVIRKAEKQDFIADCIRLDGGRKSLSSVNRSIKELVDRGVMVSANPAGQRLGRYFVNPAHLWKSNNQKERTRRIKEYYEFLKFKANEED